MRARLELRARTRDRRGRYFLQRAKEVVPQGGKKLKVRGQGMVEIEVGPAKEER
jgi:hypothetical protein